MDLQAAFKNRHQMLKQYKEESVEKQNRKTKHKTKQKKNQGGKQI